MKKNSATCWMSQNVFRNTNEVKKEEKAKE